MTKLIIRTVFKPSSKELQRLWEKRDKTIDPEILRGILKFKVGSCKNLLKHNRCRLAINLDRGERCDRCCVYCEGFLSCYSSFTCPFIHELVEKVLLQEDNKENE